MKKKLDFQRRKSRCGTTEDENTPEGSTDNEGEKLVTQEEVEKGQLIAYSGRIFHLGYAIGLSNDSFPKALQGCTVSV